MSRVCLLVKMASKIVTRSIEKNRATIWFLGCRGFGKVLFLGYQILRIIPRRESWRQTKLKENSTLRRVWEEAEIQHNTLTDDWCINPNSIWITCFRGNNTFAWPAPWAYRDSNNTFAQETYYWFTLPSAFLHSKSAWKECRRHKRKRESWAQKCFLTIKKEFVLFVTIVSYYSVVYWFFHKNSSFKFWNSHRDFLKFV